MKIDKPTEYTKPQLLVFEIETEAPMLIVSGDQNKAEGDVSDTPQPWD